MSRLNTFDEAVTRVVTGGTAVVMAESGDGTVGDMLEGLPPEMVVFSQISCASACLATAGGVAEELDVDEFSGGAIVIEDAQWSDPTSLGRLQRLVRLGEIPMLLVLGHRPAEDVDNWGLTRLASTAEKHSALFETEVTPEASEPTLDLDQKSMDLLIAAGLLTSPLPISIAASVLGVSDEEAL
ncbi:MAG: hypothetical protein WAL25_12005, partial [Acidimicrobiia bacterium]